MFTGLIEERGRVLSLSVADAQARLAIEAPQIAATVRSGDSIAVNGCCLTVSAHSGSELVFDLLAETLARTNLGQLLVGAPVNLEQALQASGRLGGHFVQGHIDCPSPVLGFEPVGRDHRLTIALPAEFSRYVIQKGSIAINGISLTVAEVHPAHFIVWIIPHTLAVTSLASCKAGDLVNLEFDLLAKYVERLTQRAAN